jgi:hypothetical protein
LQKQLVSLGGQLACIASRAAGSRGSSMGSVQLDKSLDDLIAEKQTRRTRDRAPRPDASANRESGARRDFRHRSHVDHAHEPRSGPKTSYWQVLRKDATCSLCKKGCFQSLC